MSAQICRVHDRGTPDGHCPVCIVQREKDHMRVDVTRLQAQLAEQRAALDEIYRAWIAKRFEGVEISEQAYNAMKAAPRAWESGKVMRLEDVLPEMRKGRKARPIGGHWVSLAPGGLTIIGADGFLPITLEMLQGEWVLDDPHPEGGEGRMKRAGRTVNE